MQVRTYAWRPALLSRCVCVRVHRDTCCGRPCDAQQPSPLPVSVSTPRYRAPHVHATTRTGRGALHVCMQVRTYAWRPALLSRCVCARVHRDACCGRPCDAQQPSPQRVSVSTPQCGAPHVHATTRTGRGALHGCMQVRTYA